MEFVSFPSYYPDQQKLCELARQFHSLGPDALHRFITALFAGELSTTGIILRALEHPVDWDFIDAPPVLQFKPRQNPASNRKRITVRRAD
jgi:hypothetical protein